MDQKRKKKLIILFSITLLAAVSVGIIWKVNSFQIVMNIPDEETINWNYGEPFIEPDVTATYKGTLLYVNGKNVKVEKIGTVNENAYGTYVIEYKASYGGITKKATKTVVIENKTAPVISLKGRKSIVLEAGEEYKEPGYRAKDDADGDLSDKVEISGAVDCHKTGKYMLSYMVSDSSGNQCEVKRKVEVVDTQKPTLTLAKEGNLYLELGSKMPSDNYKAVDLCDGDLTSKVQVDSDVDTGKKGIYHVKYQVADSSGNLTKKSQTVFVYQKQEEIKTKDPGKKIVYLTFDDGPGKYTNSLLKVLKKYGVKATFFVTNQYPDYQELIKKEYRHGHTVAVHTYSHDYSKIYSSQEAYFEDLQKMSNICKKLTGEEPKLIRFPGGSSNAVSKKYCSGIMTDLTEAVEFMGYEYCDWNVASGDAGETTSTAKVVANVEEGMKNHDVSVVLQHDIKGFSVDAVEEIIVWGLANDYTFLPMDESTPMVHHSLNN